MVNPSFVIDANESSGSPSLTAKAQARHRAKRKAYIEQVPPSPPLPQLLHTYHIPRRTRFSHHSLSRP